MVLVNHLHSFWPGSIELDVWATHHRLTQCFRLLKLKAPVPDFCLRGTGMAKDPHSIQLRPVAGFTRYKHGSVGPFPGNWVFRKWKWSMFSLISTCVGNRNWMDSKHGRGGRRRKLTFVKRWQCGSPYARLCTSAVWYCPGGVSCFLDGVRYISHGHMAVNVQLKIPNRSICLQNTRLPWPPHDAGMQGCLA